MELPFREYGARRRLQRPKPDTQAQYASTRGRSAYLDAGFLDDASPFADFAFEEGVEFLRRSRRRLGALREHLIARLRRAQDRDDVPVDLVNDGSGRRSRGQQPEPYARLDTRE